MSSTENSYSETDLGNVSPNPRGEYSASAEYEYLDTVSHEGGSYLCLAELGTTVTGIAPVRGKNTDTWQLLTLPGDLTPEYVAMHDDVVNKAKQVESSRAAVEQSQQEIEAAQTDVTQLHTDTRQAAQEASDSRDSDTSRMSCGVLRDQYAGETGYNPGSQMVQIAGISLLDPVDHYIKEQLHVRYYIRYMDDFWILLPTKEQAEETYLKITEQLQTYGLEINEKKSQVTQLRKGFAFLGFQYHMTDTGKVIMTLNPDSVKHERKTLVRMTHKVQREELDEKKIDEHHASWENNADKGNSYKMKQRTNKYLKNLRKGKNYGSKKNEQNTCGNSRGRKSQSNRGKAEKDY